VSTALRPADRLGAWKMRWGLGRLRYHVPPGLYAVGQPTPESPVLVSANYKLSFDRLRAELDGKDTWLLVLDTQGVNVWCAAGKGTFCADEIVRRLESVRLPELVTHKRLIVPQLAAPGVAGHEVRKRSGFRVTYGPVRAEDLPAYLAADMQATPDMRTVRFGLLDRLVVVPVELVRWAKYEVLISLLFLIVAGLGPDGFSLARVTTVGLGSVIAFLVLCIASIVLGPALLPWLPGRAFSTKGAALGLLASVGLVGYAWFAPVGFGSRWSLAGWCLLLSATASFLVMSYTGSTTYTSLSGVRREMRVAVPLQLTAFASGVALWIAGRFF
jgi:hypothetical protein